MALEVLCGRGAPGQRRRCAAAPELGSAAPETQVLYHQTSPEAAAAILASGGAMRCSLEGHGGRGVYFTPQPEATHQKANSKGVILECVVALGRVKHIDRPGPGAARAHSAARRLFLRYDSVALTFLDGGVEFVVYDPRRVLSIAVHRVLPSCRSGSSFGGSAAGSLRIPAGVDPAAAGAAGCAGASDSGSDGCSSGSRGGSFVGSEPWAGAGASSSSGSTEQGPGGVSPTPAAASPSEVPGARRAPSTRAVPTAAAAGSSTSSSRGGLSAQDLMQHTLMQLAVARADSTSRQQQQQAKARARARADHECRQALQQMLQAQLLHLQAQAAAQEEEQQRHHEQQQQQQSCCSSRRILAC